MSDFVSFLASGMALSEGEVRSILMRAPVSYKFFEVDKRRGGKRSISQPAREVKCLQRLAVQYLSHLPIHSSAMAYRKGISIRDNAARHSHNGPIKKYDLREFFHSIRANDWVRFCEDKGIFRSNEDVELSGRLFFCSIPSWNGLRLAMGAPSSPWLSNVMMNEFDEKITEGLISDRVTYTRYADDLTFSALRTGNLTVVDKVLRSVIKDLRYPRLTVNEEKTVTATLKYRRSVTGLIIANDGRVTLGRERKRQIRAAVHHVLIGKASQEDEAQVRGWLAYAHAVEPAFIGSLRSSYGDKFDGSFSEFLKGA